LPGLSMSGTAFRPTGRMIPPIHKGLLKLI
jgi:hypothetical protein